MTKYGKPTGGGNLRIMGENAWSYSTQIRALLPDGRSIGNDTKYSATSSHHQSRAGVRCCDIVVSNVPQGVTDLVAWYQRQPA